MAILRHEINILDHLTTGANDDLEIAQLDTTQYNGTVTYYFEILASIASGSENVTLRRNGTTTDDVTIAVTGSTTPILFRSASFTPPSGATEYILHCASTNANVKSARIIIIQDAATITNTETQIEIGNYNLNRTNEGASLPLVNPKYWKYDASKWDGTTTFYVEVVYDSGSMDTVTIELNSATSIETPSWAGVVNIVNAATTTVPTRTRVAFTPVDGKWYRITSFNGSMDNHDIYRAGIVVQQSGTVTKLEPQYLLANTLFAAGTALQLFLTKWDSTEWSGVTNTYYLQAEAGNNSTSDVTLQQADGGGLVTGSTLTNIDNAQISAAMTMPASEDLDVIANGNAGDVAAARILVTVVVAAAVANTGLLPFCISPQGTR